MRLSAPIFHLKRLAKRRSRDRGIPLNKALDHIAGQEGYASWSLLAARLSADRPSSELLARLSPGDLVLLGARPGHGKTMVALELIAEAAGAGRAGVFLTFEYNEEEALERFRSVGGNPGTLNENFQIDASDAISADHIVDRLKSASRGTIAVIDYLQLLDQDREKPEISKQVSSLKNFAAKSGVIIVFLSQIDRSFELTSKPLPELADVRLPNPLDLTLFDKACFLSGGKARIDMLN